MDRQENNKRWSRYSGGRWTLTEEIVEKNANNKREASPDKQPSQYRESEQRGMSMRARAIGVL